MEDVAIHVTTSPSEALIRKCKRNLDNGLKPVVITMHRGAVVAEGLADQAGFGERLDIFEAEQFLAGNLYELGKFALAGRRTTTEQLVEAYNRIIDECETDLCTPPCGLDGGSSCSPGDCGASCPNFGSGCQ